MVRPDRDAAPPVDAYLSALHARWLGAVEGPAVRELDASLLFADISGFTKMSERLARLGRVGAEELQDAMNHVFAGLLRAVTTYGGDVLKFGGDALFVIFPREGHEARAAAAAVAMQDALREVRRLKTDAGTVTLRMSVGAAAGPVTLCLAGGRFRELLAVGPTTTRMVGLESAAAAGEVRVDDRIAAADGVRTAPAPDGTGHLVRGRPLAPPASPLVRRADEDPRGGLPVHLRDRRTTNGEHRTVCVSFVRNQGVDALLEREGPDAVLTAVHHQLSVAQDAAERFGVTFLDTDVDKDGFKTILVAGAPDASEDDPDRLLLAAREVVAQAAPGLVVRAGANRARLFTGDVGSPGRRVYTTTGDGMNLAARVMGKAEVGRVLATTALTGRLRSPFVLQPIPPFPVKGKTGLIEAAVVGEPRVVGTTHARPTGPLVGREEELAEVGAALRAAAAGDGGAVEVVGEAGIGKSRLVAAAREAARDFGALVIEAAPYGVASPYLPLRAPLRQLVATPRGASDAVAADVLRARVRHLAPELEPWLPLLAVPFGLDLPDTPQTADLADEFAAAKLADLVVRLLEVHLQGVPGLLVVEDGHWLDEASTALVGRVADAARERPWLVLASRRPGRAGLHLGDRATVRVALEALDDEALATLLLAEPGAPDLPVAERERLVARAAGNPFVLGELVAALREGRTLDELPESVEALVQARIDTLTPPDRALLRHAAVLGQQRVPLVLLRELAEDAVDDAALARLDGFLEPDGLGEVRFRHALLRDAAYATLSFTRRRRLHARAGELLEARHAGDEDGAPAGLLSLHFHAARRWDRAWRWSRRAGEVALRRGAPAEAATLLSRALEARANLPEVAAHEGSAVAELLADCHERAGHYDEAAAALTAARRLTAGDPVRTAELCRKTGELRAASSGPRQALGWYTRGRRALDEAPPGPQAERVRAHLDVGAGLARLRQGRYQEAIARLEPAVDVLRAHDDRPGLARALNLLDWAYTDLGAPLEHLRTAALPIFEELGDLKGQADVLNNLGLNASDEGRWDEALRCFQRSQEVRRRTGDVVNRAMTICNMAELLVRRGRLDEALELTDDVVRTARRAGHRIGLGVALTIHGSALSRGLKLGAAEPVLAEAVAVLEDCGADRVALEARGLEAERLAFAGRPDAALRLADAGLAEAARLGVHPGIVSGLQRCTGFALAQRGQLAMAHGRLELAVVSAVDAGAQYEELLALEALTAIADRLGAAALGPAARAAALREALGVVRLPPVPLGPRRRHRDAV